MFQHCITFIPNFTLYNTENISSQTDLWITVTGGFANNPSLGNLFYYKALGPCSDQNKAAKFNIQSQVGNFKLFQFNHIKGVRDYDLWHPWAQSVIDFNWISKEFASTWLIFQSSGTQCTWSIRFQRESFLFVYMWVKGHQTESISDLPIGKFCYIGEASSQWYAVLSLCQKLLKKSNNWNTDNTACGELDWGKVRN